MNPVGKRPQSASTYPAMFGCLIPGRTMPSVAVVAETCFLLARAGSYPVKALAMIERGVVRAAMALGDEVAAVRALFQRYDNVPASLADACGMTSTLRGLLRSQNSHWPRSRSSVQHPKRFPVASFARCSRTFESRRYFRTHLSISRRPDTAGDLSH